MVRDIKFCQTQPMEYVKLKHLNFAIALLLLACTGKQAPPESLLQDIEQIRENFAPDKRTALFNVTVENEADHWVLSGETSEPAAFNALSQLSAKVYAGLNPVVEVTLLPGEEFGDSTMALVRVSVANLRREPKHSAELVDQTLMGRPVRLLKSSSYWVLVQTEYGYLGWVTAGSLEPCDQAGIDDWKQTAKVSLKSVFAQVLSRPAESAEPVCDAVLGSVFKFDSVRGPWTKVVLPDGRSGYLKSKELQNYKPVSENAGISKKKLVATAKMLLGMPYLWGGNSSKGLDCSGFTQTVFRENGLQLPRDANMQVELGTEVNFSDDFHEVQPGDLLFFGPENRITHVGISLGGAQFIHSSGDVHINSLHPADENFNPYRRKTLRYIKRIIDN